MSCLPQQSQLSSGVGSSFGESIGADREATAEGRRTAVPSPRGQGGGFGEVCGAPLVIPFAACG